MFNKRVWLNSDTSPSTGSVVGYYGPAWWSSAKEGVPTAFFEVSDCHNKVRLHLTDNDTPADFISKLRQLSAVATELADYIAYHKPELEPESVLDPEPESAHNLQFDLESLAAAAKKAQQKIQMAYNPSSGLPWDKTDSQVRTYAESWRGHYGSVKWEFDPWTGKRRSDTQITLDPTGLFILPEVK